MFVPVVPFLGTGTAYLNKGRTLLQTLFPKTSKIPMFIAMYLTFTMHKVQGHLVTSKWSLNNTHMYHKRVQETII